MNVIVNSEVKRFNDSNNNIVKIILDENIFPRLQLNILYYKDLGYSNFMIEYDYTKLTSSINAVAKKLNECIFKIVESYDIKLYISGFPKFIYERDIIGYSNLSKYTGKIFLYESSEFNNEIVSYNYGYFFKDIILQDGYSNKFSIFDIEPELTNLEKYEYQKADLKNHFGGIIDDEFQVIIDDFLKDKSIGRKNIRFVDVFEFNKRKIGFEYLIYNDINKKENLSFVVKYFNSDFFTTLSSFLLNCDYFKIRLIDNYGKYEKEVFFGIKNLSEHDKVELFGELGLNIDDEIVGIRIKFKDLFINTFPILSYDSISSQKVKDLCQDLNLSEKKILLKFLNSFTKPLVNLDFNKISNFDGAPSRKIFDFCMGTNSYKNNHLSNLLYLKLSFLDSKLLNNLEFDLEEGSEPKLVFVSSIKYEIVQEEELE